MHAWQPAAAHRMELLSVPLATPYLPHDVDVVEGDVVLLPWRRRALAWGNTKGLCRLPCLGCLPAGHADWAFHKVEGMACAHPCNTAAGCEASQIQPGSVQAHGRQVPA